MKVAVLLALCFVVLVSCAQGGTAFQFYVVIKPDEAGKFVAAVTSIAKEDGLEFAVGEARSDTGNVLRVVEGRDLRLELWVQNVPLSGQEDPLHCGLHHEAYSDPAQFVVSTQPRFFESSRASAVTLGQRVYSQLQKLGFDARVKPAICGAAALRGRA